MEIPRILELAWERAPAGREAAERDSVLRQVWRVLQRAPAELQHATQLYHAGHAPAQLEPSVEPIRLTRPEASLGQG